MHIYRTWSILSIVLRNRVAYKNYYFILVLYYRTTPQIINSPNLSIPIQYKQVAYSNFAIFQKKCFKKSIFNCNKVA